MGRRNPSQDHDELYDGVWQGPDDSDCSKDGQKSYDEIKLLCEAVHQDFRIEQLVAALEHL